MTLCALFCSLFSGLQEAAYAACKVGNFDTMLRYCRGGGDANYVSPSDSDDRTLLLVASSVHADRIVSLLLSCGARVADVDTSGYTALHWAALHDSGTAGAGAKMVEILVAAGADVNAVSSDSTKRQTALHLSARMGNMTVVKALLKQKGIQPEMRNKAKHRQTPAEEAEAAGFRDVARLLREPLLQEAPPPPPPPPAPEAAEAPSELTRLREAHKALLRTAEELQAKQAAAEAERKAAEEGKAHWAQLMNIAQGRAARLGGEAAKLSALVKGWAASEKMLKADLDERLARAKATLSAAAVREEELQRQLSHRREIIAAKHSEERRALEAMTQALVRNGKRVQEAERVIRG